MNSYKLKQFNKEDRIVCVALTSNRPHFFYKNVNEELKKINKNGFLVLDLKNCNDEDDRFFEVPFSKDGVKWSKLKKLENSKITKELLIFCEQGI